MGRRLSGNSPGIGDAVLGCVFGLIGLPAFPAEEYATFQPGFTLGVPGKLLMSTGDDGEKVLNLGDNSRVLQVGSPMTYSMDTSLFDPLLMRVAILPSVTFYTDNDNPFNAQNPLFNLEAHIIRNLSRAVWLSIDTTAGIADDNTPRAGNQCHV